MTVPHRGAALGAALTVVAGVLVAQAPTPFQANARAIFKELIEINTTAHLDVVEARREDWSYDPFAFTEKDGYF